MHEHELLIKAEHLLVFPRLRLVSLPSRHVVPQHLHELHPCKRVLNSSMIIMMIVIN